MSEIRFANAPVSFGIFELATGAPSIEAEIMAARLAELGYQGIDLGPLGYLGAPKEVGELLGRTGLDLAGGWVDLPFHDDELYQASLPTLQATIDVFTAAAEVGHAWAAKPTLAASTTPARAAGPGKGATDPGIRLSEAQWDIFAANVNDAGARIRRAGFAPTFHHHTATFVEAACEIDEFLARTEVDLTFDTGHLIVGGGQILADFARWRDRINHIHIKDVHLEALAAILASGDGMLSVWEQRAFCALGSGDLDLPEFLSAVAGSNYTGWIEVEQDLLFRPGDDLDEIFADQQTNLAVLAGAFGAR